MLKAPFLIDFEKSLRFSLISFENVRKMSLILLNFFLNCPQILQNFSLTLLDFEFQNAVGARNIKLFKINLEKINEN